MGVDLLAGGAVDAHPGHRSVRVLQEQGQFLQAVKAPALQRIVLEIAATPFRDSLLLGMPGSGWQGYKAPVLGKGGIQLTDVWVIEAGSDYSQFEIIMAQGVAGTPPKSRKLCSRARRKEPRSAVHMGSS